VLPVDCVPPPLVVEVVPPPPPLAVVLVVPDPPAPGDVESSELHPLNAAATSAVEESKTIDTYFMTWTSVTDAVSVYNRQSRDWK
jgi:hypothetical protein